MTKIVITPIYGNNLKNLLLNPMDQLQQNLVSGTLRSRLKVDSKSIDGPGHMTKMATIPFHGKIGLISMKFVL